MSRPRTQPPPDPPLVEDKPPEGYEYEWVATDGRRVATPEEKEAKKCRRPGCGREPVMALRRSGAYGSRWWLYCDWHLYGSRIEGNKVLSRCLRPLAEYSQAVAPPVTRKPTRARALGVTQHEYERRLNEQRGHCALCDNRPKSRRLHVDHDHATLEIRGLLCMRCNRALPTWVTPDWLLRAALYLDPAREDEIARARAVAYALLPEAL